MFVFGRRTEALVGDEAVTGIALTGPDGVTRVPAELVVRAIGHRGTELPCLPFDVTTGRVLHACGRVTTTDGMSVPGTYVVGWAKRGPCGGIGANRADAEETVQALLTDAAAGRSVGRASAGRDAGRRPDSVVGGGVRTQRWASSARCWVSRQPASRDS